MVRTRQERARAQITSEVEMAARLIVTAEGAAGLSLSRVARAVGVTPSALYHHYEEGLDDIISALARDLVKEIVIEQSSAVSRYHQDDLAGRLLAATRSFRYWCISHPQEFHLLFGAPAPLSPQARTTMTGMWMRDLASVWGGLFQRLWDQQPFPILNDEQLDAGLAAQLDAYRTETGVRIPLGALVVFLSCWRSIYGAVSIEVMGHLPAITDQEPIFELMLTDLFSTLGLEYRPADHI